MMVEWTFTKAAMDEANFKLIFLSTTANFNIQSYSLSILISNTGRWLRSEIYAYLTFNVFLSRLDYWVRFRQAAYTEIEVLGNMTGLILC